MRSAMRPIPRGRVSRAEALSVGLVLADFAVMVLALATNLTAAMLNQVEGIAGFASRGMALQTVMLRYKRESGESVSAMMMCVR
jgi:heme O synthase-like polyprenyltransferase